MTQIAQIKPTDQILEVGTGSGYQAAILAEMAQKIYTIERISPLAEKAQKLLLDELKYKNIVIMVGDGSLGLPQFSPFDVIIVTAATPDIPKPLINQLAEGGRLVIPKGGRMFQDLLLVKKHGNDIIIEEKGGCVFVPLIGKYGWKKKEFKEEI
jgi:protein-L-isoaspartate(D-aspartate) O-methyltransferase